MSRTDVKELAGQLLAAYSGATVVAPPSSRDPDFDLTAGYAVEAELTRLRREEGRVTVGRKVGYANKALWRKLKLDTLVWASMYEYVDGKYARASGPLKSRTKVPTAFGSVLGWA